MVSLDIIDEKFSLENFEKLRLKGHEKERLSNDLSEIILKYLDRQMMPHIYSIAERLNNLGHNLKLYEEPSIGDVAFRDDGECEGEYFCKLRFGVDMFIAIGFDDTIDSSDIDWDNP